MATREMIPRADSMLDVERTLRDRLAYLGRLVWRDRSGVIGLLMFLTVVLAAVFAPLIAPYDPLEQNLRDAKMPPAWYAEGSWEHILGTDNLGRDLLSRVIYGSRVSLTVGFFGVLIAGTLGLVAGAVAGYLGGRVDAVIMGAVNLILSLPYLLVVVVIASVLGRSLLNVILIFGITDAPIFARVTRGEVMRIRQSSIEFPSEPWRKLSGIFCNILRHSLLHSFRPDAQAKGRNLFCPVPLEQLVRPPLFSCSSPKASVCGKSGDPKAVPEFS